MQAWIEVESRTASDHLLPSRVESGQHISTRQYARVVKSRVSSIGLKATLTCQRTKNLRAVQLLPGDTMLKSTVRHLGIEIDDALAMAEHADA